MNGLPAGTPSSSLAVPSSRRASASGFGCAPVFSACSAAVKVSSAVTGSRRFASLAMTAGPSPFSAPGSSAASAGAGCVSVAARESAAAEVSAREYSEFSA